MKVAHLDSITAAQGTVRELLEQGRNLENDKNFAAAVGVYNSILKKKPLNEMAYTRLMIVYRKMKDYGKEIAIIDQAIKKFEEESGTNGKVAKGKIESLSLSLGKLTGLIDKKGKSVYDPEPLATWRKRRLMAQKRLKTGTPAKSKKEKSPLKT